MVVVMVLWTMSLPTRGAWIEIGGTAAGGDYVGSRSPHGERGLKCGVLSLVVTHVKSLPTRGAWIEI